MTGPVKPRSAASVALGGRSYEVMIGAGLIDRAGRIVKPLLKRPQAAVVMDRTVANLHGERLLGALRSEGILVRAAVVPPGEETKSFAGLAELCDDLLALGLERSDQIIAFGGGVVGDLAGFAAAIFKRGIDFIQIPTTLLAQVDSSVGGKTAIDTPRGKNLIGAFHQPRLVLADLDVLATLPGREMVCGYAEVLKYGLLGDADFFAGLEAATPRVLGRDDTALAWAVRRCVDMKAQIVAEDERRRVAGGALRQSSATPSATRSRRATGFGEALRGTARLWVLAAPWRSGSRRAWDFALARRRSAPNGRSPRPACPPVWPRSPATPSASRRLSPAWRRTRRLRVVR